MFLLEMIFEFIENILTKTKARDVEYHNIYLEQENKHLRREIEQLKKLHINTNSKQ